MFEQVSEAIKQEIDRGHAPCCSIVCHGPKGQFIQCFGIEDIDRDRKIDRNTRFPMGCVTKMFISAAVFQLCVVEGINMESPIQKALYGIPAFADLEFAKYVSINDVLTHSIGITNNALKHYLLSHESSSTVVNVINDEFDILKFRKQYNYSSMPFVILQYVIEYITGMSWKSYIEKSIFQPAGIEKIAFIEEFDKGNQHNMALPYIRKEKRFIRGDLIIMESFDSGLGLVLNTDEIARLFAHNFLFTCDSFIKQACVPQRNTFGGLPFREVLYDFSSVCGNIMQIANEKILYHIGNYPGYSSFLGYCVNAKMYISIMTNVSNSLLPIVYALSLAENRDENVQKWNARF